MQKFQLRSPVQRHVVKAIKNNDITVISGPAGSGKTLLSIWAAYQLLKDESDVTERIVIIRLAAETCGEKIGALPGGLDEKLGYLANPIIDNLRQFLTDGEIRYMLEKNIIEVLPVSHARGRSFQNSVVIAEEIQNLDHAMVLTLVTRIAEGSRMVLNGDPNQVDVLGRNGIRYAINLMRGLEGVATAEMGLTDVHRHPLIAKILARVDVEHAYPEHGYVS
jgi:phosphate starvation-inducible PhoH-like protein